VTSRIALLCSLVLLSVPATAAADGFISPYLGANFGGDTTERSTVFGGAIGYIGDNGGFELDFGYTPEFYSEEEAGVDGKVVTAMANFLLGGRRSGFAPYLALGLGVIRTNIQDDLLDLDAAKNSLGWNAGIGAFMGRGALSVRADARYFRAFDYEGFDDFDITSDRLAFWRGTVGIGLTW
jgi:opacity protein-like surface antigen